jgi:hypothetical protein
MGDCVEMGKTRVSTKIIGYFIFISYFVMHLVMMALVELW